MRERFSISMRGRCSDTLQNHKVKGREGHMSLRRRDLLLVAALAGAAGAFTLGQAAARAAATDPAQSAASIPDFSGIWAHPGLGFGPPWSGPGPVRNKLRLPSGAGNFDQLVGD